MEQEGQQVEYRFTVFAQPGAQPLQPGLIEYRHPAMEGAILQRLHLVARATIITQLIDL